MKSVFLGLTAAVLSLSFANARAETPNEVIESAIAELATALDGRRDVLADDRDSLYEIIDGILLPRFDRQYAARLVLARHWRSADKAQRNRFIDAFYNSMLKRYADGVLEFQEDRVEVLNFRGDLSKSRVQAKTIVRLDDGTKVPVDYGFVNRNDSWKLFDVTVEGVSFIRNFRTELDSEIRQTSLDAVIERLESEVSSASGASGEGTVSSE
ncbi:MAG: ABC transporter substrate-binding protein [Pseudomonadota bacterium]